MYGGIMCTRQKLCVRGEFFFLLFDLPNFPICLCSEEENQDQK